MKNAAKDMSEERAIDAFVSGLSRLDFQEQLGRIKPKTISYLMEIASSWADGEDSVQRNRARSPQGDDRRGDDRRGDDRRNDHGDDRRRKRKGRGYEEADGREMMAAGYPARREDDNHQGADRNGGYRGGGYRDSGGHRR